MLSIKIKKVLNTYQMQNYRVFFFLLLFVSCSSDKTVKLDNGVYRCELQISDLEVLPFNFEVLSINKHYDF